ncbi:hypothetical protein [Shewanella gaetbuli]|uniref:Uncharacterized protein n=1 Tax=Shewanella gaetbuli TaxID=220752 RepID=A0A9X1ZN55_9GAMM|nr:hypothetical protein [Shewanella gaetbuli]MCL1142980.1 hypothetical protein [Shewanella gaetbuli]
MALVQEWVESISLDVPEPMAGTIARQVRMAIQEFFRQSEAWRHRETFTLTGDEYEFILGNLPANTYAYASRHAYITYSTGDRHKLTSTLPERLNPRTQGCPTEFAIDGNVILLSAIPPNGVLEVEVVVQPTRNIGEVDDAVCDRWFEYIRHGALAGLLKAPDRVWTNKSAAAEHERQFLLGIAKAKREMSRNRSRPKRNVRFNKGFAW